MALLEVKNIKKKFGKTEVLRGIDLSLERGEVLCIIGSSGSGKTTLLRCLNFLEEADEGSISVGGECLFDASRSKKENEADLFSKRLHFGLVFQNFNLFPQYTAKKNITLAMELRKTHTPEEIDKIADQLLASVGLTEKAQNYPCQLSGGQQQRVAIARALALEPDILCFDEPTSALDPELTGEVLKVIKELGDAGRTMIVVTHEMDFARNVADRIIFMADGVIEEEGSPRELFDNPKSEKMRAFLNKSSE